MEVLFILFIFWLISKTSKGKQPQKRKSTEALRRMQEALKAEAAKPAPKPTAQKQEQKQKKAPIRISADHQPLAEGDSHLFQSPFDQKAAYVGSLHTTSTEGMDLCDPLLGHDEPGCMADLESVYAQEIGTSQTLDFDARAVYQGVVMSEILARRGGRIRR